MKKIFKANIEEPKIDFQTTESELNLFDPTNPDIDFFNLIDDESIRLSGSKIFYYKFYESKDYDEVYMESKTKPISRDPIIVYGHYDPKVIEENLSKFGIELQNDQTFIFNKPYIERMIGRQPIPGDIVKPQFQEVKYELKEVQEDSFESYGIYHYNCTAKVLRDAIEILSQDIIKVSEEIGHQNE